MHTGGHQRGLREQHLLLDQGGPSGHQESGPQAPLAQLGSIRASSSGRVYKLRLLSPSPLPVPWFLDPVGWRTCVHVCVAAQGALGGSMATVTAPLVVPLVFFRWHPLQGVVIQAPGLGAQHGG